MAKAKRKALSQKIRFEVFKRDSFTCQYCGRKAPDVVLQVDHIVPVAKGGHQRHSEPCDVLRGLQPRQERPQALRLVGR